MSTYKDKPFLSLTDKEKRDLVDMAAMLHIDHMKSSGARSESFRFIQMVEKQNGHFPYVSSSTLLKDYIFHTKEGLCLVDKNGDKIPLKFDTAETAIFIHNAISIKSVRSPLVTMIQKGMTVQEINNLGIDLDDYPSKHTPPGLTNSMGRRVNKNSLAQRILRGEITRYEAYQKAKYYKKSGEDSL